MSRSLIPILLTLICLSLMPGLTLATDNESVGVTLSSRKVLIVNPSPFSGPAFATLNVSFLPGEAYNATLQIYDHLGNEVPFQLINASFFPGTLYYKSCTLRLLTPLGAWSHVNMTITFTKEARKPMLFNTDLVVYTDNVTGNVIVENTFYKVIFGNVSTEGIREFLVKTNKGEVSIFTQWPLIGFSLILKNGSVITPLDYANITYTFLMKGPLEVIVRLNASSFFVNMTQFYTFRAYSPVIDTQVILNLRDYSQVDTLYMPLIHTPIDRFDYILASNGLGNDISRTAMKSYRPAPFWLALLSREGGYGVGYQYNCTRLNLTATLDLIKRNVTETWRPSLLFKIYKEHVSRVIDNATFVMKASRFIKSGLYDVEDLLWSLEYLKDNTDLYEDLLFTNVTQRVTVVNFTHVKRLILFKGEGYSNVAYQLNETSLNTNSLGLSCKFMIYDNIEGLNATKIWADLYRELIRPVSILVPFALSLEAPPQVEIDKFFNVSAKVTLLEDINRLNVTLLHPEGVELASDIHIFNFTKVKKGEEIVINWTLIPFYEGNYTLSLFASSERGDVLVEKPLTVQIPFPFSRVSLKYNLTVVSIDQEGRPLPHVMIRVYDNRSGLLVGSNVTDINGTARFYNLDLSVYKIIATDGVLSNETTVYLYRNTLVPIVLGRASLYLKLTSVSGKPMEDIAVYIYDVNGSLVFMGYTNANGTIHKSGLPLGNYTISLRWLDTTLDYFSLNLTRDVSLNLTLHAYQLTLYVRLSDGRALPGAKVSVSLETEEFRPRVVAYTDEYGKLSLLLPRSRYVIRVEKGQYRGEARLFLGEDESMEIVCSTINTLWVLMGTSAGLWAFAAFYWHRVTRVTYREEKRYSQLLQRLEELYRKGLIEEKYYLRLKSEYEEKLRKIRGEK